MNKLLAALSGARDSVDANIAFGEAGRSWSRFKNVLLVLLVVACALLAVGYVNMQRQIDGVKANSRNLAEQGFAVLDRQTQALAWARAKTKEAEVERHAIMKALGIKRANGGPTR